MQAISVIYIYIYIYILATIYGMPNVALFDISHFYSIFFIAIVYTFLFEFNLYSLPLHTFIFVLNICSFLLYVFRFYFIFDHLYTISVYLQYLFISILYVSFLFYIRSFVFNN